MNHHSVHGLGLSPPWASRAVWRISVAASFCRSVGYCGAASCRERRGVLSIKHGKNDEDPNVTKKNIKKLRSSFFLYMMCDGWELIWLSTWLTVGFMDVYGAYIYIYCISGFYGVIYKSIIAGGPSCRVLNKFDDAHWKSKKIRQHCLKLQCVIKHDKHDKTW